MEKRHIHLEPGSVVDRRYRVVRRLGVGSSGVVYLCQHIDLPDVPLALKMIWPDGQRGNFALRDPAQRFYEEFKNTCKVSHRNVVRTFGFVREGDLIGYAMEYVEGGSLKQWLHEKQTVSYQEVIDLLLQIATGVQAIHNAQIIHRDLKPTNILLSSQGEVKITDFGIARSIGGTVLTAAGNIVGTVGYLSPEYLAHRMVSHLGDIYSLGVVGYEILTGKLPFRAPSVFETVQLKLKTDPQPPHLGTSSCPPELSMMILKALRRDPAHRYQSANEFIRDLLQLREQVQLDCPIVRAVSTREAEIITARIAKEAVGEDWDCARKTVTLPQPLVKTLTARAQPNKSIALPLTSGRWVASRASGPVSGRPSSRWRVRQSSSANLLQRHLVAASAGVVLGFLTFFSSKDGLPVKWNQGWLEQPKVVAKEGKENVAIAKVPTEDPASSRFKKEVVATSLRTLPPSAKVASAAVVAEAGGGEFTKERLLKNANGDLKVTSLVGRRVGEGTITSEGDSNTTAVSTRSAEEHSEIVETVKQVNRALISGSANDGQASDKPQIVERAVGVSFSRPLADELPPPQYRVIGAMLYRMANYITWPQSAAGAVVKICIVGEDPFKNYLSRNLSQAESRLRRRFEISTHSLNATNTDLAACSMVFLANGQSGLPSEVLDRLAAQGVLTVTERAGGGIIDFLVRSGRIRFTIDVKKAQKGGIILASSLLEMAENS